MIFLYAYLVTLYVVPQQWIPPFIDWPVDVMIYPTWLAYVVLTGRWSRTKFTAAEYFFITFIFWVGISILFNGTSYNFSQFVLLKYTKWFVLYFLIRCTVVTIADMRKAAAFTVAMVYFLVVEGIQHKLSPNGINWAGQTLGWVDPSVLAAGGSGRTKWLGVFDGIGVFAVAYTIALPFVLQYASSGFKWWVTWLNRAVLPFLLIAIYFTGSRGGLLATLALISLHLAVKYKVSLKTIVTSASIVMLAFTLAPSHLTETHDSSNSAQNRVDVWGQGLGMMASNPIWGVGRGNFLNYTQTIIAHNSGVEIMAETGLFGLFFWMSMITACLRAAYLRFQAAEIPAERHIMAAVMLGVVGYIVSAFFITLEYETFYMLLAFCVGGYKKTEGVPLYGKREFYGCLAGVFGFAIIIKIVVSLYF